MGADIAQGDQEEIDRAIQLQLLLEIGPKVPLLYILMDGTGVPVRESETDWTPRQKPRRGRMPDTRSKDPPPMPVPSRPPNNSESACM